MWLKNKLKKIRDFYCWTDFYLNRGLAIFNGVYQVVKYTAFSGIIVDMLNRAFGKFIYIPMDRVIFFTPIFIIFLILSGLLDVKSIHILQKTNEIATGANPYLVKLIEKNKQKLEIK